MNLRTLALAGTLAAIGCGNTNPGNNDLSTGGGDMAVQMGGDMAGGGGVDMASGGNCLPDPMKDGQPCGNGCPVGAGTIGVNANGVCNCWYTCTPKQANSCPCGRICQGLCTPTDGGCIDNGMGACLPANGAGEHCGLDANQKPYHNGSCQDGTLCVNEDMAGKFAYCIYKCTKPGDCPDGTTCLPLQGGANACVINNAPGAPAVGMPCMGGQCDSGAVCDNGTCVAQCDGAWDMVNCGMKKCTAVTDSMNMRISAYICK